MRTRYEVMVCVIVEAGDDESANLLTEEVLPTIGYTSDDAEIVDVMITGNASPV